MSHAITHPVNKTAHTGINQFHVASQVGPICMMPPPYFLCPTGNDATKNVCSTCPDGRCAISENPCPKGTDRQGRCSIMGSCQN